MNPILIHIGPLNIRWYSLLMAFAFILGYLIYRKMAKREGISEDLVDHYFIYVFFGLIIGARLGEVLFYNPVYYFSNPIKIFYTWEGGLASHGAILGGIIATLIFCRAHKARFYKMVDLLVVIIALGSVFVRIGNFINGEIVGRITNVPWAVKFEGYEGLRHPVQLYEAGMNLVVFVVLLGIRKIKKIPEGFVSWSFLFTYSFLRFFVEFFKEYETIDSSYVLTMGQFLSIAFLFVSCIAISVKYGGFLRKFINKK